MTSVDARAAVDEQPVRPASAIVLAREHAGEVEVFMLERTSEAVFAGGMHVFPGGRVDDADHAPIYRDIALPFTAAQAAMCAAIGPDALGYWVAAIRECFEEAGFLLAVHASGEPLHIADEGEMRVRFDGYREALHDGHNTLAEICTREGLRLAIDRIHFLHAWVTPAGRPRRFDTRFFLAAVPPGQSGVHDNVETVSSYWITPREAVARNDAGTFGLMGPTRRQLETFATARDVEALLDLARNASEHPTFRPEVPRAPAK